MSTDIIHQCAAESRDTGTVAPPAPPLLLRLVLYIFCFSLCFENYNPFGNEGTRVTFSKIMGILLFCLALYYPRFCFKKRSSLLGAFFWILFWSSMATIYYAKNFSEATDTLLGVGLTLAQCIVLFWVCCNLCVFPRVALGALGGFAAGAVVMAIMLSMQIGVSTIIDLRGLPRISFLDTNANLIGNWLATAAVILMGILIENYGKWGKARWLLAAFFPFLFSAIAQTGSRGSLLLMAVGPLMFFFTKKPLSKKIQIFVAIALVTAIMSVYVSQSEIMILRWRNTIERGDVAERDSLLSASWELIKERPFFGWGFNAGPCEISLMLFGNRGGPVDPHNVYTWLALTSGLVGVVPFLYIAYKLAAASIVARNGCWGCLPLALLMLIVVQMGKGGGAYLSKLLWMNVGFIAAAAVLAGAGDKKAT